MMAFLLTLAPRKRGIDGLDASKGRAGHWHFGVSSGCNCFSMALTMVVVDSRANGLVGGSPKVKG